jgi:hypothetical protein
LVDFELEEGEHHITDGVTARGKCTNATDEWSEEWPGAAREIGSTGMDSSPVAPPFELMKTHTMGTANTRAVEAETIILPDWERVV